MGFSWICLAFCQMYISHTWHVIDISPVCTIYTYKSSVSPGFTKQIMHIIRILCYNDSLVIWKVVSLTTGKFMPLVFSMSSFVLSYTANTFILMILCDFCLLPAQFCYIIVYIRKVESRMKITDRCAPCFIGAAILRDRCLPLIPRLGKHKSLLTWSVPYGELV
jgi:hypothetical protein